MLSRVARGWAPRVWAPRPVHETAWSRSIKTLSGREYVSWQPPLPELTVLSARLRDEGFSKGGLDCPTEIRSGGRVPICIMSRDASRKNARSKQIDATLSVKAMQKIIKAGRIYNQVFLIEVEGRPLPVKAIVSNLYRLPTGEMEPINICFTEYTPGKRHKIQIPAFLTNRHESWAIKKGAVLQKEVDYIPCFWKGDENIPSAIYIDLLEARPPTTFLLDRDVATMPPGIGLKYPTHAYTLCTLKGTRKYRLAVGESDDKDVEEEKEDAPLGVHQ